MRSIFSSHKQMALKTRLHFLVKLWWVHLLISQTWNNEFPGQIKNKKFHLSQNQQQLFIYFTNHFASVETELQINHTNVFLSVLQQLDTIFTSINIFLSVFRKRKHTELQYGFIKGFFWARCLVTASLSVAEIALNKDQMLHKGSVSFFI